MKTTIVYAHPWEKSFNHAVLETVMETVKEYHLIDLYADGFDPVMRKEDLALYALGQSSDPLVKRYNEILDDTDRIVFIFPIWWYDMPAMMRGFLDKVMLEGSGYRTEADGLHPVRDVKETYLFTTSSTPTAGLIGQFGDAFNTTMIPGTFRILGFNNALWKNLGSIDSTTLTARQTFLSEIRALLA